MADAPSDSDSSRKRTGVWGRLARVLGRERIGSADAVAEALRDPQIAHRGAMAEVEDGGGSFKVLNLPFRMSGAKVSAARRMSTLGEHTRAYLKETGLSEDEIAAFAGKAQAAARR